MSQNTLTADTPRDGNFEPQTSHFVTPTQPAAKNFSYPSDVPVFSVLPEASNRKYSSPGSPVSSTLASTNASSQPLLDESTTRLTSTTSEPGSVLSSRRPRNLSLSPFSQSTSDQSHSDGALQTSAKKVKGFLDFWSIKEPSTKALEEFAEQQQRELKEKGLKYPFGVSTSKLPEHVPRVNTKWDGLPDNKRDAILAAERQQQKKTKPLVKQRRRSMSTVNQEAALHARRATPTFVPSSLHRSRHSIGSTNPHSTPSTHSESHKFSDPYPRPSQARPSSTVPSLAGSTHPSGSADGSVASPSHYAKFNVSNEDGSAQSDSDILSSSEDWIPQTFSTMPPLSGNGHRKSVSIAGQLTSSLEDGMSNAALPLPFVTEAQSSEPTAVTRRLDVGVSMHSTVKTSSTFLAGQAQELDVSDDLTDEGHTPRKDKSTYVQETQLKQWPLSATSTSEKSSFAGNPTSAGKHFRMHHSQGNSDHSSRSIAKSVVRLPKERTGRGYQVEDGGAFRRDALDVWPPSPPKDSLVLLKNKFRRSFFGKN